ncbi:MAG: helix-turn-helix domain-containing protein [Magnetococcales bacterium]|nr:helix-turn-helix domain-containing protein [Magnetococcales bacterium]
MTHQNLNQTQGIPVPRKPIMLWPDIKAAFEKRGMNFSAFSLMHGYHPTAACVTRRSRSAPMQTLIADFLGVKPQDLWPDRYDDSGHPIGARNRKKKGPAVGGGTV